MMRWLAEVATLVCSLATAAPGPDAGASAQAPTDAGVAVAAPVGAKPLGQNAGMSPEVKSLVGRMQAFYEKTTDFTAKFEQTYRYQASRRTQTSSGTVVFRKPGLMRWEYLTPTPRTFVLAGEKVYAYDPQAMTLTVARLDTHQLSASVTFLWGQGKLADEFSIEKGECKDCKGTWLELTPLRPDPRFRRLKLEVDPKTAQVLRSVVVDPDGSENTLRFLDLKRDVGVDKSAFSIHPPEGTQIVDYTQPGGSPVPTK